MQKGLWLVNQKNLMTASSEMQDQTQITTNAISLFFQSRECLERRNISVRWKAVVVLKERAVAKSQADH
ncbi:hypothetical protein D641_0114765 [Brachybacterium muris UCD-AY4]|uniref:Uncharacterized protein n=1 Tax=Brachybacterium muris UCD-AY4 TaxID=1249481 RepID=A0A022KPV3_9MICO|nr:hypothetical protein D641_0114765 [Brachybacterium muris UCD-AY4]